MTANNQNSRIVWSRIMAAILFLSVAYRLFAPPPPGGGGFVAPLVSNFISNSSPGAAGISIVSWTNGADGSARAYHFTNTVSAGDSLTGSLGWEDADATWSVLYDSAGNTWTAGQKTNSIGQWAQEWRCVNAAAGGSPVITIFTNGSAGNTLFIKGGMIRWSGASSYDQGNYGTNFALASPGDICISSNITTTASGGLYAFSHNYSARTCIATGINWTLGRNVGGISLQWRTNTTAGTYNAVVTNSGSANSIIFIGSLK